MKFKNFLYKLILITFIFIGIYIIFPKYEIIDKSYAFIRFNKITGKLDIFNAETKKWKSVSD